MLQRRLKMVFGVLAGVLLSGCASTVFPDFEDDTDIVVDDGGRVEVRRVTEDGVLVSDKDNASYDDEKDEKAIVLEKPEKVTPAAVVEVKKEKMAPVEAHAEKKAPKEAKGSVDNVKIVEGNADIDTENVKTPSMHYLAATVYFEDGGAVVDASYNKALRNIAKLAKENDALVTVYGFASSRTRDTDPATHKLINFNISAKRAQNAAKALRRAGVPADKIVVRALSDSMPMYLEVMPAGERLNRRAEIYLTY